MNPITRLMAERTSGVSSLLSLSDAPLRELNWLAIFGGLKIDDRGWNLGVPLCCSHGLPLGWRPIQIKSKAYWYFWWRASPSLLSHHTQPIWSSIDFDPSMRQWPQDSPHQHLAELPVPALRLLSPWNHGWPKEYSCPYRTETMAALSGLLSIDFRSWSFIISSWR